MGSFRRWSIPAICFLVLYSIAQAPTSAKAQVACTVTFTCPSASGGCASSLGGQVTTRNAGTFASTAECNTKARNANPNLGGVGISCSCNGGDSAPGSTAATPVAPGHEFDSTINRAIADGLTGRISAGNAVGFTVLGVLGNALFAPKTPNVQPQPDPAEQQRQLAAQQLNSSGIYLLRQKNYTGAINEFQKALAISPGDADILHNLDIAKHQLKDAAFADQTSGALGELLGPAPVQLGSSGAALNLVNLDSDPSVVDLRNTTRTTVDPATLKGQLDSVFSNIENTSTLSDSQNPRPQAQDIDKLFEAPQSAAASSAQGNNDSSMAQEQAAQVAAKQKQLDDVFRDAPASADFNGKFEDLKDAVSDRTAASVSGSSTARGDNQATAGGSTNFFGSSNGVSSATAGLDNSAPAQVRVKTTTEALISVNNSGAVANAEGGSATRSSSVARSGFDTLPSSPPTLTSATSYIPRAPAAAPLDLSQMKTLEANPQYQKAVANKAKADGDLAAAKLHFSDLKANPATPPEEIQKATQQIADAGNAVDAANTSVNKVIRTITILPAPGSAQVPPPSPPPPPPSTN